MSMVIVVPISSLCWSARASAALTAASVVHHRPWSTAFCEATCRAAELSACAAAPHSAASGAALVITHGPGNC